MAQAEHESNLTQLVEEAIQLAHRAVLEDNVSQRRQMEELSLRKLREVYRRRAQKKPSPK